MVSGRGVVALRLGLATIAVGVPPRRVGVAQGVVAAIGVAVEGLGACRVLHVGVHREEAATIVSHFCSSLSAKIMVLN